MRLEVKMIGGLFSVDCRFQIRRVLLKGFSTRNKTETLKLYNESKGKKHC